MEGVKLIFKMRVFRNFYLEPIMIQQKLSELTETSKKVEFHHGVVWVLFMLKSWWWLIAEISVFKACPYFIF